MGAILSQCMCIGSLQCTLCISYRFANEKNAQDSKLYAICILPQLNIKKYNFFLPFSLVFLGDI